MFLNSSTGRIVSIIDHVITGSGLFDCFLGEVININDRYGAENQGYVMNIERNYVKISLLQGHESEIFTGDLLYRTCKAVQTKVGFNVLGSVITPLGFTLSDDSDVNTSTSIYDVISFDTFVDISTRSPSIVERCPVTRPFLTGITVVDCFIPIGCGQRELIIGDNNSGKTSFAVTCILNQKKSINGYYKIWRNFENNLKNGQRAGFTFTPCIYVSIGKKRSEIIRIRRVLITYGAYRYTCLVFSSCDDLAALQFIAPYAGATIGEWFRDRAYHALIVYDDLSQHAVSYRQISLLLRRPPGREAYPGDVFYVHSKLLERAAQLSKRRGGGSLTALPIIETRGGDVSGYVATNVISITDGQIFLSISLANRGIKPSVDIGLSVSRVGSKSQYNAMKAVTKKAKRDYALFKAYEGVVKVGHMDDTIKGFVIRGLQLISLFNQRLYQTHSLYRQLISLFAVSNGYLDSVNPKNVDMYFNIFFAGNFVGNYLENKSHISFFMNRKWMESLLIINSLDFVEKELSSILTSFNKLFVAHIQHRL